MSEQFTIGTWNLCLGLPNKKDIVVDILSLNKVNICCLQETEIPSGFPENVLNVGGYTIEMEKNCNKKRAGIYISTDVDYTRRNDLESENMHVVIIDVESDVRFRVFNIYRSFRPPDGISADTFFENQLRLISRAMCNNCYVVGDFNLDVGMAHRPDYSNKLTLGKLENFVSAENLTQIVNFDTWSRVINGTKKSSLLDHIYVKNPATVVDIYQETPPFGDHLLVIATLQFKANKKDGNYIQKRDWKNYKGSGLQSFLSPLIVSLMAVQYLMLFSVQDMWNCLENILVNAIEKHAPLSYAPKTVPKKSLMSNSFIKSKLNTRKRLLKYNKDHNTCINSPAIKILNKDIRIYFRDLKISNVKRAAMGTKGNVWKAVKVAKNLNIDSLPKNLTLGGRPIAEGDIASSFAGYFSRKVTSNVESTKINPNVYNGKCKMIVQNRNFMTPSDVNECMNVLVNKKCEGFDRIPLCCISDAKDVLLAPFSVMFDKIYKTQKIPEQWKVSKIIPVFKKGNVNQIENYRPIANLCSASKIFERLILKQINYLESKNALDLTGKQQHGFKKNKSTATAGCLLQSLILRAADDDCYVAMASMDLSMAFDLVNVELLVKRLRLMGLPNDLVGLIREWLTGRSFYVQVGGDCSTLFESGTGTIQGSVLGPVLYAIYVSPLFDLTQLTNFADDNYYLEWNRDLTALISNLEKRLEMITKWLKDSGLVVNENKTELCLFHKNDKPPITIKISNTLVTSKKQINVLGVLFDCKLNWNSHTAQCIAKAKKSLFALRLLKRNFNNNEMRTLLDANFFSILYYNSIVWLTPNLSPEMKQSLLSISANALRSCLNFSYDLSFENVHKLSKKCTPNQIMLYQISLKLHKVLNDPVLKTETLYVIEQSVFTSRQTTFEILRDNKTKIGMNTQANKFYHITKMIGLEKLNYNFVHFKKTMKNQFLKYGKT